VPDGKEGVDGSSPSEGFAKFLLISSFCCSDWRRFWVSTSTERPPACGVALGGASKPCWRVGLRALPAASTQRPPLFVRECVEQRDGVFTAVVGEVAVVAIDHRDAGTHES